MKKLLITIYLIICITTLLFGQAPNKISYQAVLRNASNGLVTSSTVGMKISILQGSATSSAVYSETHSTSTNANGLVSLEIGTGTAGTGTFSYINWANGPYFIKTETDPTGGTTYTISGVSELLSVPYALYASKADSVKFDKVNDADSDATNELQVLSYSNDTLFLSNSGFVVLPTPGTGPQGPKGDTGAQGIAGTQGPIGMTGPQGTTGMTGPQGLQGLTGEKGDTGVTGPIGIQGMTGAQGATGMTGPQGIQGAKGDTGLAGAIGPQGLQGIQGMTGAQGTTGIQGLKGDTGVTGPEGPEGVQAISISNDTLYLSNGGSVYLGDYAKDSVIDSDNDSTNEIQVLNYSNDTLYLSSSNFVVVPSSSGNTGVPVGTIMLYAGNSIPTGWILCDGSAISRSTYSTLFTALGTSWGQGDNSTTFNLPDMRGRFARGVDAGADNDPDASGRTALHTGGNTGDNVGSYQSDEIKSHGHLITSGGGFGNTSLRRNGDGGNTSGTQNEGGLETRPVNAGVYYIIKF